MEANQSIKIKGLKIEMDEIDFVPGNPNPIFKIKSPKISLEELEFSPFDAPFPIINVLEQIKDQLANLNQSKEEKI